MKLSTAAGTLVLAGVIASTAVPAVAAPHRAAGPAASLQRLDVKILPSRHGEIVRPANFAVRPGVPVTITFLNSTRDYHAFTVPGLGVTAVILPATGPSPRATRVTFTADRAGAFSWYCVFCWDGEHHGDTPMGGLVYAVVQPA